MTYNYSIVYEQVLLNNDVNNEIHIEKKENVSEEIEIYLSEIEVKEIEIHLLK